MGGLRHAGHAQLQPDDGQPACAGQGVEGEGEHDPRRAQRPACGVGQPQAAGGLDEDGGRGEPPVGAHEQAADDGLGGHAAAAVGKEHVEGRAKARAHHENAADDVQPLDGQIEAEGVAHGARLHNTAKMARMGRFLLNGPMGCSHSAGSSAVAVRVRPMTLAAARA